MRLRQSVRVFVLVKVEHVLPVVVVRLQVRLAEVIRNPRVRAVERCELAARRGLDDRVREGVPAHGGQR